MRVLLALLLPLFVPFAAWWVRREERRILSSGQPLSDEEMAAAQRMGVRHPERVRLLLHDEITGPAGRFLRRVFARRRLFGPHLRGITYRYGIAVRRDCYPDPRLLAHECVHTAQYESLGGLRPFLHRYLRECLLEGYPGGPLEQEAIARSADPAIHCQTPV